MVNGISEGIFACCIILEKASTLCLCGLACLTEVQMLSQGEETLLICRPFGEYSKYASTFKPHKNRLGVQIIVANRTFHSEMLLEMTAY